MIFFIIILSVILFILFFIPLILGIPAVYFTLRLNQRHEIIPYDRKELPHTCMDFFSSCYKDLFSMGFSHISYYKHTGVTNSPDAVTYVGFLYNSKSKVTASVMYAIHGNIRNGYIELASKFRDSSRIVTYNSTSSSSFTYPSHIIMRKVNIKNTEELFHDHLMSVEKLKGSTWLIEPDLRKYMYEANEETREILSYQVEKGLMRVCDDGTTFGPTFTGAFGMVIKEWILFKWFKIS